MSPCNNRFGLGFIPALYLILLLSPSILISGHPRWFRVWRPMVAGCSCSGPVHSSASSKNWISNSWNYSCLFLCLYCCPKSPPIQHVEQTTFHHQKDVLQVLFILQLAYAWHHHLDRNKQYSRQEWTHSALAQEYGRLANPCNDHSNVLSTKHLNTAKV